MTILSIRYERHAQRRDTEANWAAGNPILADGEIGLVTDSGHPRPYKIGDGSTAWNSLVYATPFFAVASGTNTITATFDPTPVLFDGMEVKVRAAGANTGAATFNGLALTKHGGTALAGGEIAGAGHELDLRYRSSVPRWELLNPFAPSIAGLATLASPTFTGTVTISEALALTGDISPSQITASQDDYAPTGFATSSVLRLSSDASRNITGLAGGADGRIVLVANVGSNNIVLKDESGSSTAANRFALSADITLSADTCCVLLYDTTSSRWRAISAPSTSSGGGISSGTSNPGSPSTGDLFWRSDLYLLIFYDGTRWLTVQEYTLTHTQYNLPPHSATATAPYRYPVHSDYSMYLTRNLVTTYVLTTSSNTQYWTGHLYEFNSSETQIGAAIGAGFSTQNDAANTHIRKDYATGRLLDSTARLLYWIFTKVSTPGNLYPEVVVLYRKVVS